MKLNPISRRAALVGLTTAGLSGCMPPKYKVRCKLTVTAEVNGRVVTASGVREGVVYDQPKWLPTSGGISSGGWGEAVILELGGNRVLVAGLRGFHNGRPTYDTWNTIGILAGPSNRANTWSDGRNPAYDNVARRRSLGPIEVPPSRQPMFIEFPDRRQATGMVRDPEVLARGGIDGVMVTKATIELTRDRIYTGKPEETFPWLRDALEASRRGGGRVSDPPYYPSDILLRRRR